MRPHDRGDLVEPQVQDAAGILLRVAFPRPLQRRMQVARAKPAILRELPALVEHGARDVPRVVVDVHGAGASRVRALPP
jgi:hypothetical protein